MPTGEQTFTEHDNAEIRSTVERLTVAASDLEACSDGAKLRGIVDRLAKTARGDADPVPPLAAASSPAAHAAVETDPWVEVDRLSSAG
jgi:hypothetical protein